MELIQCLSQAVELLPKLQSALHTGAADLFAEGQRLAAQKDLQDRKQKELDEAFSALRERERENAERERKMEARERSMASTRSDLAQARARAKTLEEELQAATRKLQAARAEMGAAKTRLEQIDKLFPQLKEAAKAAPVDQ